MFARAAADAVAERGAQQRPFELAEFGRLLITHGVERVLEIGTCYGGTAWFLAELGLHVTAIDIELNQLRSRHPDVEYVCGDSKTYDADGWHAVLIDGDHSYNGAKADWERYRGARLVAFHDILPHDPPEWSYVDQLWGEIKPSRTTIEITGGQGWGGIGVVLRSA